MSLNSFSNQLAYFDSVRSSLLFYQDLAQDTVSDSEMAAIEDIRESNRLILIGISLQMLLFAFLFWRLKIFNCLFASSSVKTFGMKRDDHGPVPMSDVVIASCASSPAHVKVDHMIAYTKMQSAHVDLLTSI